MLKAVRLDSGGQRQPRVGADTHNAGAVFNLIDLVGCAAVAVVSIAHEVCGDRAKLANPIICGSQGRIAVGDPHNSSWAIAPVWRNVDTQALHVGGALRGSG